MKTGCKGFPEWMKRLPLCGFTRKIGHPGKPSAMRHLRHLERRGEPAGGLNAYRCSACLRWHVGRWTPQDERRTS